MSEWNPIGSAPLDGTPILISDGQKVGIATLKDSSSGDMTFRNDAHAWIGDSYHIGRVSVWLGGDNPRKATHWMPLPSAPKGTPNA